MPKLLKEIMYVLFCLAIGALTFVFVGCFPAKPVEKQPAPQIAGGEPLPTTPYEALERYGLQSICIECPANSADVGGKELHWGPNINAEVKKVGDKYLIEFSTPIYLRMGMGVQVPLKFEVTKDGMYAQGTRFGITKRQKIVFADAGDDE